MHSERGVRGSPGVLGLASGAGTGVVGVVGDAKRSPIPVELGNSMVVD